MSTKQFWDEYFIGYLHLVLLYVNIVAYGKYNKKKLLD